MSGTPRPRGGQLWTTADVARVLRVGVSSIKRWTDEGELEAIRTPGGHRRYTLPSVYRFASIRNLGTDLLPKLDQTELFEEIPEPADITLYDALADGDYQAVRQLVTPHVESTVQRAAFLDRVVGESLREIGYRWERGELGVDEEHRAAHMIAEALERMRPRTAEAAPLATLVCPPGELHELPLHLVRLILEWSGWRTELLGGDLPWEAARDAVERSHPGLLAFSARSGAPFQTDEFKALVGYAAGRGVTVVTGGEWARGGAAGAADHLRFRSLRGFEKWLRGAKG